MPRYLDLECSVCGEKVIDLFVMQVPSEVIHIEREDGTPCYGSMEHLFLPQSRSYAQWSDKDAVVVYKKPDGSYSYPGRNDLPTPQGCERVVMRSLREVQQFEKTSGTRSEMAWFDKGSGRGFDDIPQEPRSRREDRERAFIRAWKGQ